MRRAIYSGQFKRDLRRAQRRGKDMDKFKDLARRLLAGEMLPAQFRDHPLKGTWSSFRDAHLEPDWLVIYKIDGEDLRFERTGTHSDLFEE